MSIRSERNMTIPFCLSEYSTILSSMMVNLPSVRGYLFAMAVFVDELALFQLRFEDKRARNRHSVAGLNAFDDFDVLAEHAAQPDLPTFKGFRASHDEDEPLLPFHKNRLVGDHERLF